MSSKTKTLYEHLPSVHNLRAPREVVPILMQQIRPKSVLDVGCGIGTWLKAFQEAGVADVVGIDGDHVKREQLQIDTRNFVPTDLRMKWNLGRRYDLVISLEVAEHLPERSADLFVEQLCAHGMTIVFSAAIPGQMGQNHINEQWPNYWEEKFKRHGFYFHDTIRPLIWKNTNVDFWYKQNIFLLTRERRQAHYEYVNLVHPEMVEVLHKAHRESIENLIAGREGIRIAARICINSIVFKLRSIFRM